MDERFSERVLELLFDDDFELLDGCGSDEDCSEGPFGNDELQLEELDALAREVTSAYIASTDGGSSDEGEDDGDFVPAVVSGDEIEGKTEIAINMKSWPAT